jgi:hypothetical protein
MDNTAVTSAGFGEDGPDTLIGPYKVVRQLGEGGMGVVYYSQFGVMLPSRSSSPAWTLNR